MKVRHSGPATDLSVIIPTYNAKARAHKTVTTLHERLAGTGLSVEILLVDDGSRPSERPDQSQLPAEAHVVQLDHNRGKGYAVRAGLLASNGARRIFTDVDLPYGTDAIIACYEALGHGADVVFGDRTLPESTKLSRERKRRRVSSAVFRVAVSVIAGLRQSDTQCGIKGIRGGVAEAILPLLQTDGFAFDVEVFRCAEDNGLTVRPMPVVLANGDGSTVRLVRDSAAMMADLVAIRSRSLRGHYRLSRQIVEEAVGATV